MHSCAKFVSVYICTWRLTQTVGYEIKADNSTHTTTHVFCISCTPQKKLSSTFFDGIPCVHLSWAVCGTRSDALVNMQHCSSFPSSSISCPDSALSIFWRTLHYIINTYPIHVVKAWFPFLESDSANIHPFIHILLLELVYTCCNLYKASNNLWTQGYCLHKC